MTSDVRDRWPLLGAAALVPVTVAASRRRELRPLAVLLWHQTEEWVWPGSFLPWINREVIGSEQDEFPLDRAIAFPINVLFGWGLSLAVASGRRDMAAPAALLYTTHIGNAGLHVAWAARHRRYDPGSVSSLLALGPLAILGLRELASDEQTSRRALVSGVACGVGISVGLMPLLKRRLRHSRTS